MRSNRIVRIIVLALLVVAAMATMASDCDVPVEGKVENIDRGGNVTVRWPNGSKSTIKDYEVSGAISEGDCILMNVLDTKASTCK